jgi:signal transduction histidine kinase
MLNNLSDIVDSAVKQVREISHNLSPHLLRRVGLIEAIRIHLKRYSDQNIIEGDVAIVGDTSLGLSVNVEIALYRIFLELFNNTIKHSGASRVRIRIEKATNYLKFDYSDNGKGFEIADRTHSGGIGLLNIQSRINALRGSVKFRHENNEMITEIKISL